MVQQQLSLEATMSVWGSFQPAAGWTIHAAVTARGLCRLDMATTNSRFLAELTEAFPGVEWSRDDNHPRIRETARQLAEYFQGKRTRFDVPLDLRGTGFRMKVWRALRQIPYGETRSYGEVARAVGNPKASRAVGGANGSNPVGIIVPCHRVIEASGGLGGFGCGLGYKRKLLDLEAGAKT
jgi:O-6-methylguanine DNA methyltransferase